MGIRTEDDEMNDYLYENTADLRMRVERFRTNLVCLEVSVADPRPGLPSLLPDSCARS